MRQTLTAKQQCALENYLNPQSDTFNNCLQSLVKAGYTHTYAHKRGWQMLAQEHIIAAMAEYKRKIYDKQSITAEYIQSEHLRLAKLAEEKGDIANATRNLENLGKTIAAYTDNVNQHIQEQESIEQAEQAEAKRIAAIRLRETA